MHITDSKYELCTSKQILDNSIILEIVVHLENNKFNLNTTLKYLRKVSKNVIITVLISNIVLINSFCTEKSVLLFFFVSIL